MLLYGYNINRGGSMIESIITKMILDRVCPVCQGHSEYRTTESATTERVKCNACDGKGYTSDCSHMSVLLVPSMRMIPAGVAMSMKSQNMLAVDSLGSMKLHGYIIKRLYAYNVYPTDYLMEVARWRQSWCHEPTEIHMYFD